MALPCRINGGSQIPFAPLLVCWPAVFEDLCHYALGARRLARVALRDLIGCWLGKPPEAGVLAICGASAFSLSPAADLGADLNRSRKASAMELASEKALPASEAFGGKYIIRTGKTMGLDGTAPQRFVVIAFDSVEKAKAWDSSPAQKEVNDLRRKSTKSRVFIADGELK